MQKGLRAVFKERQYPPGVTVMRNRSPISGRKVLWLLLTSRRARMNLYEEVGKRYRGDFYPPRRS
jgi:hypothetical protein